MKNSTHENRIRYKKQKNFCSKLYKKEGKKYYSNTELKNFTDDNKFWRTVKPLISDKGVQSSRITLVDKKEEDKTEKNKIGESSNETISDDLDVANTLNEYFRNTITKLGITEYSDNFGTNTATLGDPVNIALEKIHRSSKGKIIKENVYTESLFHFTKISVSEMTKELSSLNSKKQQLSVTSQLKYLRYPLIFAIRCFKKYGIPKF